MGEMSMVERVARALSATEGDAELWPAYTEQAHAAIKAMRKPPPDMFVQFGSGEAAKWAPGIWECMIDAALSPSPARGERG